MTLSDPKPGGSPLRAPQGSDTYRALFEKSADASLIIEDGTFVDCNQATLDMMRYADKAHLLEVHPSVLSPPTQPDGSNSRQKANEMIRLAFAKGNHRFEWEHVRADGEVFPAEVLLTVVPIGEKSLLHVVWRDITERKKLESDLRQAQKMEAIGKLAGGIAHDFNNLLVAILGNAELLEEQTLDQPDLQSMATEVALAARRASDLTRQLLAFSRKQVLQTRVIDLNDAIQRLGDLLKRLMGETLELETRYSIEPLFMSADPGQIDQIVMNLVTNARDAMPRGGVICVKTSRLDLVDPPRKDLSLDPGSYAVLTVSDTGQGMHPEVMERAFEPFFTTKPVHEGTGLGLATVYGIVKQSHGDVQVESEPGRGSVFRVYLPLCEAPVIEASAHDEETNTEGAVPDRPDARASSPGGHRILVVEDEPAVSSLIQRVLESKGYQVVATSNGIEALDLYRQDPEGFDLILSDVIMPEMTGPELIERLEQEGFRPNMLLATGYVDQRSFDVDHWPDGVDLLQKPFSMHDLVDRVRHAIGRRDHHRLPRT